MKLFDPIHRTDSSPSRNIEGTFSFLNRSSSSYWGQVRNVLEDWFKQYPQSDSKDLMSRVRTDDDVQFYSAFWELYLHEVLRRAGVQSVIHPRIADVSTRPDFAVTHINQLEYVEVLCVFDPIEEQRRQGILAEMFDYLNANVSASFYLVVQVDQYGSSKPRAKALSIKLSQWLASLPTQRSTPNSNLFEQTFVLGDWIFRIMAAPKTSNRDTPLVAAYPMVVRWVDDHAVIRNRLSDKARRYGNLASPFAIGVWTSRITTDLETIMRALFGADFENPQRLRTGVLPRHYPRDTAGLWVTHDGPKRQDVSAVIFAHKLFPWTITSHGLVVIHNPWAYHQFSLEIPIASEIKVSIDGELTVVSPKVHLHDYFELPLGWPQGKPFPGT